VQHLAVGGELELHQLQAVARQPDDVQGAVGAGDLGDLGGHQDAWVDHHVDAQQALVDALLAVLELRALQAGHGAARPQVLPGDAGHQVDLVIVGDPHHQIGLGGPGLLQQAEVGPVALQGGHVVALFDDREGLGVAVDGHHLVLLAGQGAHHVASHHSHTHDDGVHQPSCWACAEALMSPASMRKPLSSRADQSSLTTIETSTAVNTQST
jgi:hypothetical protein